jgi:predicted HTH transcriptional regulator
MREAGSEMISEIRLLARNTFFDEQPCAETNSEDVNFRAASEFFADISRPLNSPERKSLGLVV